MTGKTIQEMIVGKFNDTFFGGIGQFLAVLAFMCIALVVFWVAIRYTPNLFNLWKKIKKGDIEDVVKKTDKFASETQRLKSTLLKQYQDLFNSKIGNNIVLPLNVFNSATGMNAGITSDKILKEVIKNEKILIIGKPGSGKSTLLLQLAISRFGNTDTRIDTSLIPILINISSWERYKGEGKTPLKRFQGWLESYLQDGYGFSKIYSQQLIQQNSILPLFDGFDELALNAPQSEMLRIRTEFLTLHRDFLKQSKIPYHILTSRPNEFEAIDHHEAYQSMTTRIEIQPLSLDLIKSELNKIQTLENEDFIKALMAQFQEDQEFEKLLGNPFYFNLLARLIQGDASFQLPKCNTKKEYRDTLISLYKTKGIQYMQEKYPKYSKEQIEKFLTFLSFVMQDSGKVVFELSDLQPKYVVNRKKYSTVFGIVFGIIGGIVGGTFGGTFGGIVFGIVVGIYLGISLGIILGIDTEISLAEKRKWNWESFFSWKVWKKELISGIVSVIIWGIFGGIFGKFIGEFFGGIICGIVFVFAISIAAITYKCYTRSSFSEIKTANQKIRSGVLYDMIIWGGIIGLTVGGFMSWYENDLSSILVLPLLFGVLGFLTSSYFRFLLTGSYLSYFQKDIPNYFKLVEFLETCASPENPYALMVKPNGGSWRFQHRLIQEAFFDPLKLEEERKKRGIS